MFLKFCGTFGIKYNLMFESIGTMIGCSIEFILTDLRKKNDDYSVAWGHNKYTGSPITNNK